MKNRLSTVLGKMPKEKIELAKVELGIVDDIAKMQSRLQKSISDADSKLKEFKDAKNEFAKAEAKALKVRATGSKFTAQYDKIVGAADRISEKAEKAAKDLGVSPNAIKGLDALENLTIDLADKSEDIKDFDFNLGQ